MIINKLNSSRDGFRYNIIRRCPHDRCAPTEQQTIEDEKLEGK